jgi:hypothetical protein
MPTSSLAFVLSNSTLSSLVLVPLELLVGILLIHSLQVLLVHRIVAELLFLGIRGRTKDLFLTGNLHWIHLVHWILKVVVLLLRHEHAHVLLIHWVNDAACIHYYSRGRLDHRAVAQLRRLAHHHGH